MRAAPGASSPPGASAALGTAPGASAAPLLRVDDLRVEFLGKRPVRAVRGGVEQDRLADARRSGQEEGAAPPGPGLREEGGDLGQLRVATDEHGSP